MKWSHKLGVLSLVWNKWLALACLLVFAQQVVVGFSTGALIILMSHVTDHRPYITWLVAFAFGLIFPLIPGFLSVVSAMRGGFVALRRFVDIIPQKRAAAIKGGSGDADVTGMEAVLSGNSELTLMETTESIRHALAMTLNVVINVGVMAYYINNVILAGYAIGFAVAGWYGARRIREISMRAKAALASKIDMDNFLILGPENIMTGSERNRGVWFEGFKKRFDVRVQRGMAVAWLGQEVPVVSALLASAPVFAALGYLVETHSKDYEYLAVLASTLPRQLFLIQGVYGMVSVGAALTHNWSRLRELERRARVKSPDVAQKVPLVDYARLRLWTSTGVANSLSSLEDLEKITGGFGAGRFLLKGPNGAGKSTLLRRLRERFPDAHYWPAQSKLLFAVDGDRCGNTWGSTGERAAAVLAELVELPGSLFLLDEWDANMDSENVVYGDRLIDKLAHKVCVIEVRHRMRDVDAKGRGWQLYRRRTRYERTQRGDSAE